MDFKNKFSPEEYKRLERNLLFSYLDTFNSWASLAESSEPNLDEPVEQASLAMLYLCVDVLGKINYEKDKDAKDKVEMCMKIARTAMFTLAWELAERMFFLGASCTEEPPGDSRSLPELLRRAKDISRFAAKDYIDVLGCEINPVFSKAESELFRNAVFEAAEDIEQSKYAIFYTPKDCVLLYNDLHNLEDSKKVFLTLQDDKFIAKE